MASLPSQIEDNPLLGLGVIAAAVLLSIPFLGRSKKKGRESQKSTGKANGSAGTARPNPPPRPVSASPDPWSVLGLPRNASREMIKTKYHDLLMDLHPDKLPLGATPGQKKVIEDKVKEINNAYTRLKQRGYV